MSQSVINDSTLTEIADAINAKAGTTGKMLPSAMAAKITAIPSGGKEYEKRDWLDDRFTHIWVEYTADDLSDTMYLCANGTGEVNWGDGSPTQEVSGDFCVSHNYQNPGVYRIDFTGYATFATRPTSLFSNNSGLFGSWPSSNIETYLHVKQVQIGSCTRLYGTSYNVACLSFLTNLKYFKLKNSSSARIDQYFIGQCYRLEEIDMGDFSNDNTTLNVTVDSKTVIKTFILPARLKNMDYFNVSSTKVRDLVVPEGVTNIGYSSQFASNPYLERFVFASTIKTSNYTAVFKNTGFKSGGVVFEILATTPFQIAANYFNGCTIKKIVVPHGCKSAFDNATNWAEYSSYIEERSE